MSKITPVVIFSEGLNGVVSGGGGILLAMCNKKVNNAGPYTALRFELENFAN